jgi:hypothetical protein
MSENSCLWSPLVGFGLGKKFFGLTLKDPLDNRKTFGMRPWLQCCIVFWIGWHDGTFAAYIHLVQNGSVVNEGDVVTEGQLIGYSGNTGNSSGPHLHFHVWRTYISQNGFSGVQLPVRFFAENAWGFFPRPGQIYKAILRSEVPKDIWDTGTISLGNHGLSVRKRLLNGLTYTPMQSNDLKTWSSQSTIAGNGSLVDHGLTNPSGGSVFFRWRIEYESFQSFPVP